MKAAGRRDPKSLPHDPEILKQMLVDLTQQLDKTQRLLRQLLAAKSSPRSEQLSDDQLRLFAQQLGTDIPPPQKQNHRRIPTMILPQPLVARGAKASRAAGANSPRISSVSASCTICRNKKSIAPVVTRICVTSARKSASATNIPAQMLVIEDACQKYACSCTVRTAAKPVQPIEKSTAGASLLAHVIVSKVADHLPVHRQAKMLRRFGVEIADQTMCGWMRQSVELLAPLYGRLKEFVLRSKVVGTDDTPVKVLDRRLPQTRKGRIWPYVGDRDHPGIIYDYTPTRERAGPERFLKRYRGYLQADAYVAYDSFFTEPERGMVEVGCWRRRLRGVTLVCYPKLTQAVCIRFSRGVLRSTGRRPAANVWCPHCSRFIRYT